MAGRFPVHAEVGDSDSCENFVFGNVKRSPKSLTAAQRAATTMTNQLLTHHAH
jgi:hypothetical protein